MLLWYCAHVQGIADVAEATQAITLTLLATRIAHIWRITYHSVDGNKPNNKKSKKPLNPGGLA